MTRTRIPLMRGWSGRFGGRPAWVQPPPEFQATSVQACGLWPFATGAAAPLIGVPVGREMHTGRTVCSDPLNWFRRGNLIGNPSEILAGRPGLGKSSYVRRQALGLTAQGVMPLALGDLKPDYTLLVEALGGNVVTLGPGRGAINPLDPGSALIAAKQLSGEAKRALLADATSRRVAVVCALLELNRQNEPVSDRDEAIITAALDILDKKRRKTPATLHDLITLLDSAPDALHAVSLARGDQAAYREAVDPLQRSLMALCTGPLGDMFGRQTTTRLDLTKPLSIDISSIGVSNEKLTAAALLACWSEGFGSIAVEHALSDAGIVAPRLWFVILDELWRAIDAAPGIAKRVSALTRLNRTDGVAMAMVVHSKNDEKELQLSERAGMTVTCGIPKAELMRLTEVVPFSAAESALVTGWHTPPAWADPHGEAMSPPGQGDFLIKVGSLPGIAVHVELTETEKRLYNTNQRWQ